jgi:hypothetical protein
VTRCGSCGMESPPSARFCARCGTALPTGGGPSGSTEVLLRSATRLTPLLAHWRKLSTRLTRKDVRHLLGEPLRLQRTENSEQWIYRYDVASQPGLTVEGFVKFDPFDGRLLAWEEPEWVALNSTRQPNES